jgi:hypothetical protein
VTILSDHKPGCACKVCLSHQAAEAHRKAAAELEATRRDVAWFEVMGQGGPDAVLALARQHGDTGRRAERLLRAGGFDVSTIMDRWRAEAPNVAQSSTNPNLFADDPEHSGEAMEALRTGGTAAYRAKVAELTAARAAEKQARQQSGVLWRTRDGGVVTDGQAPVIGASYGSGGAPAQRSQVHGNVPELGSEV